MQIDVWLATRVAIQLTRSKQAIPTIEVFVDPQGFKASVEQLEKKYLDQLAQERARK
jgi:hypothetical protein